MVVNLFLRYFSDFFLGTANMTFADKLRQLREAKGLTRQEFAEKLEVATQTVTNWELGDRLPTFSTVLKICKALGIRCTAFEGCDFAEAEDKPGRGRPKKS